MPDPSLANPRPDRAPLPTTDLGSTGPDYGRPEVVTELPTIPGYEVFEELGKGGMGVVYRGRQVAADRVVALKMNLGGALDEHVLARFRTEARAVARLQHPNIVQVFEVGEYKGLPFFSQEFCAGGSLAKRLAGAPLPATEAAALVEMLAWAIQAAHDKGVVHRDLKPGNVLLTADGTPKVADFGVAKRLDDVGQTRTGALVGTPSYMAPEQARGEKDVGPPADVYALGAILYECLTGRPPFKAATLRETLDQVETRDPVAPRQLSPAVPRDLETICLKGLRKKPAERYGAAAELAADLARFLNREPIVARPAGRLERGAKWVRRNPVAAGLIAALSLLVVASAGAGYLSRRVQQERIDRLNAEANEQRATGQLNRQQARVAQGAVQLALQQGAGRAALELFGKAVSEDLPITAAMRLDRARALQIVSRRNEALNEVRSLDRGELSPSLQATADVLEGVLCLGTDEARFRQMVRKGLSQPALPEAERHYARGMLAANLGEARKEFKAAIDHDVRHVDARGMLALCYLLLGQLEECIHLARESKVLAPDHSHFPSLLAIAHAAQGNGAQALRQLEEAGEGVIDPEAKKLLQALLPALATLWSEHWLSRVEEAPAANAALMKLVPHAHAAPRMMTSLALPPVIRDSLPVWYSEVLVGYEESLGRWQPALLFYPEAKKLSALTFSNLDQAPAARKRLVEYPEGTLKHLYGMSLLNCAIQMYRRPKGEERQSGKTKEGEAARDVLLEAGRALSDSGRTPGLFGHQSLSLGYAGLAYWGAAKPNGKHPGRPELYKEALEVVRQRRRIQPPMGYPEEFRAAVELAILAEEYELALSVLADWAKNPWAGKSTQYHKNMAKVLLRGFRSYEAALQTLTSIPSDAPLTGPDKDEIAAIRKEATEKLEQLRRSAPASKP